MRRDLNWYMNQAKQLNNIKSDRKLAIELKVSSVGLWRHPERPVVPELSVMVRLAKMAGVPVEIGLIDRDIWVAGFKAPETVPFYEKILKQFPKYAAALLMACLVYSTDFDTGVMAKGNTGETNGHMIVPNYKLCAYCHDHTLVRDKVMLNTSSS
ncbi:hypothetical protein [Paremcibacter congregatus]|uniref:Uncharacterized protein n=1 Tax=Paremcibacter congregatus TaxID=2043170 RepID=A0A2G4YQ57_9PROT|nr:hypothetical protein [Paremcibacter congregatus]PHZ83596.1 hypothetical protein CRD36_14525 [Paremcibacter congregatus]QDE27296.1 hypothetical protein FIV45_08350 [Paremcibacter congregatus]